MTWPSRLAAAPYGTTGSSLALGEGEHARHVIGVAGEDDRIRPVWPVVREVAGVLVEHRLAPQRPGRRRDAGQLLGVEIHGSHSITNPYASAMPLYLTEADVERAAHARPTRSRP